uniref:TSA: Wollemia nobilis Ref_Wollemi_Transcript_3511_1800 transcribed RNA sequence n=1 Tax=Wollemia nobilis TaxID=56998 RepID=A0A0C9SAH3_9CONI
MQMSSACPFARVAKKNAKCPVAKVHEERKEDKISHSKDEGGKEDKSDEGATPKCPFGYDSHSFKLGPFSCVLCRALLYESSKCVPCGHKFCKVCISRFEDCPLCGADINKVEPDPDLQALVDQFIEGHARIKRTVTHSDDTKGEEDIEQPKTVTYEDVSLERGSFLVQHAMRAFQAQNLESAKSRLLLCADDIREQLEKTESTPELCSQLGAVLGMLGDCSRAMGDVSGAVKYYNESIEFLYKLSVDDPEVVHALSVSLNKIGDLKYYDGDLSAAKSYYSQSLDIRRKAIKDNTKLSSQVLDTAVSLAKVADVDRSQGNEETAIEGFQEALKSLECLSLQPNEEAALEQKSLEKKRLSVLEFLHGQLKQSQHTDPVVAT